MTQNKSRYPDEQNLKDHYGWVIPDFYSDPKTEFLAAQNDAVVHDSSYVGRLKATGPDTLDFLNRMSTNQVINLDQGRCVPTILTTDRGRILDLIHVINTEDTILILTSPGEQQNVITWLDKYTIMEEITIEDITAATVMLTLIGPNCISKLDSLVPSDVCGLQPYSTQLVTLADEFVRIIKKPLGDVETIDLLLEPEQLYKVWANLIESGDFQPMGLDAYESFRVERAIPSYSREMGESYNPLETGLIGSIDFYKGCYIGQEVIARLDSYKKIQKHLVTLLIQGDGPIPEGTELIYDGKFAGKVTSVALNPSNNKLVGLGYINTANAEIGTRFQIDGSELGEAEITGLPLLFGSEEEYQR